MLPWCGSTNPVSARFRLGEGISNTYIARETSRDYIGILGGPRHRPQLSHGAGSHCIVSALPLARIQSLICWFIASQWHIMHNQLDYLPALHAILIQTHRHASSCRPPHRLHRMSQPHRPSPGASAACSGCETSLQMLYKAQGSGSGELSLSIPPFVTALST